MTGSSFRSGAVEMDEGMEKRQYGLLFEILEVYTL